MEASDASSQGEGREGKGVGFPSKCEPTIELSARRMWQVKLKKIPLPWSLADKIFK